MKLSENMSYSHSSLPVFLHGQKQESSLINMNTATVHNGTDHGASASCARQWKGIRPVGEAQTALTAGLCCARCREMSVLVSGDVNQLTLLGCNVVNSVRYSVSDIAVYTAVMAGTCM